MKIKLMKIIVKVDTQNSLDILMNFIEGLDFTEFIEEIDKDYYEALDEIKALENKNEYLKFEIENLKTRWGL